MRNRRNYTLLWSLLAVLLIGATALLTWQNYLFAKNNRGGSDFQVQWVGTRTFLTQGTSPYSEETSQKIQLLAYGRPAQKGEPQLHFVYPLYSIAVVFPFALIPDFATSRAVYMTLLEGSLLLVAILSIRLVRWRLRFWELALFILFALFWYHSIRPLVDGNLSILVALFIVSGLLALKNGGDELAGVLFALATIKPNVVLLFTGFVVVWALVTRRNRLLGWMFGTLFILSASAALLQPDWIWQYFREVVSFQANNPPGTLGSVLASSFPAMGVRIGRLIYAAMAGMVATEWWLNRQAEFRGFLWTALFSMTIGQWLAIPTAPQNFIVLLPAVALVFATWEERWRRAGSLLSVVSILLLFGGLWALFLGTVTPGPVPLQSSLMFLPLPAFLIVTLYWVRWWAIRPPSVWFDLITMHENP